MTNKRTVLITGGASGIGKETAKGLAYTGATVAFTARDTRKGEETKKEIIEETKNSNVDYVMCDLSSFSSILKCVEEFKKRYQRLDVLINNAGVLPQDRQESRDGVELNFAVNYLAPLMLTNLLLPLLKQSAPARVINVASTAHREGRINFDDLQSKENFDKYIAYSQSKLALILFTKKLAKDLRGSGVTVNALHPGVVSTEMTMQNVRKMNPITAFIYKRILLTPEQGAETSIYLAVSLDVANVSGEYFINKKIASTSPLASDMDVADKLWDISTKLVGL